MRCGLIVTLSTLLTAGGYCAANSTLIQPGHANLTASDEMTIEGEAATLRQAYVYLEASGNSYHGHREKALKAVGTACRELGGPTKGNAHHREQKDFSDNLLANAKGLLLNVLAHAQAKGQTNVISHVEHAIQEIESALSGEEEPHHKSKSGSSSSSN